MINYSDVKDEFKKATEFLKSKIDVPQGNYDEELEGEFEKAFKNIPALQGMSGDERVAEEMNLVIAFFMAFPLQENEVESGDEIDGAANTGARIADDSELMQAVVERANIIAWSLKQKRKESAATSQEQEELKITSEQVDAIEKILTGEDEVDGGAQACSKGSKKLLKFLQCINQKDQVDGAKKVITGIMKCVIPKTDDSESKDVGYAFVIHYQEGDQRCVTVVPSGDNKEVKDILKAHGCVTESVGEAKYFHISVNQEKAPTGTGVDMRSDNKSVADIEKTV